jgi:cell division septum initiation protein DivIVA
MADKKIEDLQKDIDSMEKELAEGKKIKEIIIIPRKKNNENKIFLVISKTILSL